MDDLQILLIENACRRLVLQAAAHADAHEPERLAELFTPDGVLTRPNAEPLQGRDAIRDAYRQRPAQRITRHLVTNTRVEVRSPTEASASSYVLLWAGESGPARGPFGHPAQPRQLVGEFDDRFILTPEGWRIAQRIARFVLHCGG